MGLVTQIDNVHRYVRDMERSCFAYRVVDPDGSCIYLFQPPS